MSAQLILNMPEEEYFAIKALSASGIKLLNAGSLDYWFYVYGPGSEQESTAAQQLGSAKHLAGLEGLNAFRKEYVPAIDKRDYEGVLDSQEELKGWCRDHGLLVGGSKDVLCSRIIEASDAINEEPPALWMKLKEDQRLCALNAGQEILTQDNYKDALAKAKQISPIINDLRDKGGHPEVTILWEWNDIPCKCRIDFMAPSVLMDLKNVQNSFRIPFDKLIANEMARRIMPIQAEFYLMGAAAAAEAGLIPFDGDDFVFNWLFIQSAGTPNIAIREYEPAHKSLDTGLIETTMAKQLAVQAINHAAELYAAYHVSHGTNQPWHPPMDSQVMTDAMYPHWLFSELEDEPIDLSGIEEE